MEPKTKQNEKSWKVSQHRSFKVWAQNLMPAVKTGDMFIMSYYNAKLKKRIWLNEVKRWMQICKWKIELWVGWPSGWVHLQTEQLFLSLDFECLWEFYENYTSFPIAKKKYIFESHFGVLCILWWTPDSKYLAKINCYYVTHFSFKHFFSSLPNQVFPWSINWQQWSSLQMVGKVILTSRFISLWDRLVAILDCLIKFWVKREN